MIRGVFQNRITIAWTYFFERKAYRGLSFKIFGRYKVVAFERNSNKHTNSISKVFVVKNRVAIVLISLYKS